MTLASSGLQVHNGDLLRVEAWSNVAVTLRGNFLFRPILWPERRAVTLSTTDMAVPATRATTNATVLVTEDGFVEGCTVINVATAATQRGQTYGLVTLQRSGVTIAVLASDYIFSDYSLSLGQIVCPGPAGGPGNIRRLTTADPAAGLEVADLSPASGALWLVRSYTVQLVQGITQTPLPALEFEDGVPVQFAVIPIMPTALGVNTTAQLTWALGLVQTSFTAVAGDEMYTAPLPVMYIDTNFVVATLTDGIGANTNYGPAAVVVEEWVMPNP